MDRFIVSFFKKMGFYNKEYFNKIKVTVIDMDYEDIKDFVGFYPSNLRILVPSIKTVRDMLIWVHEYSHALFPDDDDEIFPNLMEAYFVNDYVHDKYIINDIKNYTLEEINNSMDLDHSIAKKIKLSAIR